MADVGGSIRLFSEMKAFQHDYMINVNDTQGGTQGGTQDIGRLKSSKCTILFKLLKAKIADGEETGGTLLCS